MLETSFWHVGKAKTTKKIYAKNNIAFSQNMANLQLPLNQNHESKKFVFLICLLNDFFFEKYFNFFWVYKILLVGRIANLLCETQIAFLN